MLFHDPSCRAATTLREHHALGIFRLCHLDWAAICTKTDSGTIYVDAQQDERGVVGDIPDHFLAQYGHQLTCGDEIQLFQMNDCYFRKLPIRQDQGYSVFSLYCRKGADIDPDNLMWLSLYASLNYAYTLLNNESIQEHDLSENIVDSIESAIVVLDLTGKVISCNGKIHRIFGVEPKALLSRDFISCIDPDCREVFTQYFRQVIQTEERQSLGDMTLFKGMEHIVNATLSPLRNSKGKVSGAVLVGNDVTDLRSMEHELQQSKQFGLLGQIAAGLAHDVKNPLMNINGCTNALLRNGNLEPGHRELLHIILHESGRINDVIEQMLSFGKISTSRRPTAMNLNNVLRNCVRIINRQKSMKQIDIQLDLDEAIPALAADSSSLEQAFLNVLLNSVEAIQSCGSILVRSRLRQGVAEVTIQDTGCGIPLEALKKIFKPYYSTKAQQGGSGLGLFMAKRVFDQNRAVITVASEQYRGTTVTVVFTLPETREGEYGMEADHPPL